MGGFDRVARYGAPCALLNVLLYPLPAFSQPSTQTHPQAHSNEALLDEIIVSARKIEEQVQDIPISVQVLSAEFLDKVDLSHLFDLQFNVPGLVVNNVGGYGAGFSLRGISDQGGTTLSVASHLNGVYLGNPNLAISRMFDLQRIEILKGPQGTLYGRNATGGSINFITQPPSDDFAGGIEVAYGSFDTARIQGYINLPSEKVDFRLAAIGSGGDGYIGNSVDSRMFSEKDFWGVRASLRIALTENLQLDLMSQYVEDTGASGELWLPNPDFLPDPGDLQLTTVTLADPFLVTKNDISSAVFEYELGFGMLRSTTGYAHSDVDNKDDCAGQGPGLAGCVRKIGPDIHKQWSQEFQLVSTAESAFDWLAGAYYYDATDSNYYYLLTPALSPNPPSNEYTTIAGKAYAVYGQVAAQLASRWRLTGGLRLSREESQVSNIGTGTTDNLTLVVVDGDWDNTSWRLDLAYSPADDVLAYASISTGFKSGSITANKLPSGDYDGFEPEDLLAYEAGLKSEWPQQGLVLDTSVFYYDFRDMQVSTLIFDGTRFVPETDNAAKAEIYGLDAAATYALTELLTLSGGLTWLPKRDFVEYINDAGDTLSGNKLSRVPEWTASGAVDFTYPLGDSGSISARVEYNYRSAYFFTKENDPRYWQDDFGLLNVFLDFESADSKWYVFASGRNLTDEDYFTQVFIQSSPGYPKTFETGFGLRF